MGRSDEPRETKTDRSRRRLLEAPLARSVWGFGLPLVVGMVLHTAFNLIDLFMISRLENGTEALAAIGICDMVAAIATILSNGISTASVAVISRHLGANHLTGVRRASWQSIWLVMVLSIVFGTIGIFGSDFIIRDVMQAKGGAADLGVDYLQVSFGGCFSIFLLLQLTAILRALSHAKSAASLLIGGNALNIFLNVLFIYGSGPVPEVFSWGPPIAEALGIPRLGVVGAAWATLIARTVPVFVGFVMLLRRKAGPKFHVVYLRPFKKELLQLWRLGWPSSAQLVVRVGAALFFLSLLSAAYTTESDQRVLTAFSVCLRLETMVLFVGMGWGAAASSFVGTNLGAKNFARAARSGWVAAGYCGVMMVALATAYIVWAGPIMAFFDPDAVVVRVGVEYLHAVAFTYALLGIAVVLSQAMTGAGATFESLLVDSAVLMLTVLPAAWVVVEVLEMPRQVLWRVVAYGNLAGAAAYALYYARGRFLQKQL